MLLELIHCQLPLAMDFTGTAGGCTIGNGMLLELLENVLLAVECYRNYWRMYHCQWNVTGTAGGCTIGNGMLPELLEDVPLATECYRNYWKMYHWERDEMCGLFLDRAPALFTRDVK